MEPKGVGKKGRRSLVVAIGKAQLAAASIGEGWKKGTEIRMRRDKEVGEHRETLKTIMRAWLGYSQGRPGWKEWGRCKCETKWCTCKHVVMGQDIGTHWIWMRAWKWVSGGKEKNGIEAWRRGCEGMKWRTAVRKESAVGAATRRLHVDRACRVNIALFITTLFITGPDVVFFRANFFLTYSGNL